MGFPLDTAPRTLNGENQLANPYNASRKGLEIKSGGIIEFRYNRVLCRKMSWTDSDLELMDPETLDGNIIGEFRGP